MLTHPLKSVLFLLLLSGIGITAQAQKCGTQAKREANIAEDSGVLDRVREIEKFTRTYTEQHPIGSSSRTVVTVPVVVHVIWRTSAENISDAQILSQMDVLNADFRKMNSNFSSTPSAFQSIAADVEIEFCLANADPNGNPSSGITRTQTTVNNIGEGNDWYSTANGGKDSWDIDKYLNIWVCDIGDNLLGFATPPGTAVPANSDGVVIGSEFFGTIGTAANSTPNHLGRTATHEVGHYFNLEHLWGINNGGCNEDDFVADTPNQDWESSGCPSFPELDNCTGSGNGINYNNYLDYTDDACMTMFTQGQKTRMLAALNGPRSGLLNSTLCSPSASVNDAIARQWSLFPNPSYGTFNIVLESPQPQGQSFILSDLSGKMLREIEVYESKTVNVSKLADGMYILSSQQLPRLSKKVLIKH